MNDGATSRMSFYARDQKENDVGRGGNEIRSRRLQRKEEERDGSGFGCLAAGVGIGFGSPNESLTGAG